MSRKVPRERLIANFADLAPRYGADVAGWIISRVEAGELLPRAQATAEDALANLAPLEATNRAAKARRRTRARPDGVCDGAAVLSALRVCLVLGRFPLPAWAAVELGRALAAVSYGDAATVDQALGINRGRTDARRRAAMAGPFIRQHVDRQREAGRSGMLALLAEAAEAWNAVADGAGEPSLRIGAGTARALYYGE